MFETNLWKKTGDAWEIRETGIYFPFNMVIGPNLNEEKLGL